MKIRNSKVVANFMAVVIAAFLLTALLHGWSNGHPFAWIMSVFLSIPLVLVLAYKNEIYITDDGKALVKKTGMFKHVIKEEYGMHIFSKIDVVLSEYRMENGKTSASYNVVMLYKHGSGAEGQVVNNFRKIDKAYAVARDLSELTELPFEDRVAM